MIVMNNCDRGFELISLYYDYRVLIHNLIDRIILYDLRLWQKKILTNSDVRLTLETKLLPVLEYLYESKNRVSNPSLSKWHRQVSEKLKNNILLEIDFIKKNRK